MRIMLFIAIGWLLHACGEAKDPDVTYAPEPDAKFEQIRPTVKRICGKCHGVSVSPAFDSGAAFKASRAKARIEAGTMPPPPGALSPEDKAALLAYLAG